VVCAYNKRVAGLPFLILTRSMRTVWPLCRRDAILTDPKSVRNGRYSRDMAEGCGTPTRRPRESSEGRRNRGGDLDGERAIVAGVGLRRRAILA
jgi:hypothetical protein